MKDLNNWKFPRGFAPLNRNADSVRAAQTTLPNNVYVTQTIFAGLFITACAAFLALVCCNIYPNKAGTDSSVFRYVGKVILSGGMPYRDAFDHKGPFLYLIECAGLLLGVHGVQFVEFLTLLATLAFIYKMSRLLEGDIVESCLIVLYAAFILPGMLEGGNLVEEYALPFLSVSFYIFLRGFRESAYAPRDMAICGFCCAAVVLLRVNMAGLWVVMCPGVIIDCVRKKKIPELLRHIRWFLIGFFALAAPIFLWLGLNHAFSDFVEDYILFNFAYTSGNVTLQSRWNAIWTFLMSYESSILFGAGVFFYFSVTKSTLWNVLCMASMLLNLIMIGLPGRLYPHYCLIIIPWCAYALIAFCAEMKTSRQKRTLAAVVLMAVILSHCRLVRDRINDFGKVDTINHQVADIVKAHTGETDKITVCGNWDCVYLYADRFSVSRYSYQAPVCFLDNSEQNLEMRAEYLRDVDEKQPKVIVLRPFAGYDIIKGIVEQNHYELIDTVDNVEIYGLP